MMHYHHLSEAAKQAVQSQQSVDVWRDMAAGVAKDDGLHGLQTEDGGGVAAGIGAGDDQDLGRDEAVGGHVAEERVFGWVSGGDLGVAGEEVGNGDLV